MIITFLQEFTAYPHPIDNIAMKKFETIAVRTQVERSQHREHAVPLYLTSSYVFDDSEQARALFAEEDWAV